MVVKLTNADNRVQNEGSCSVQPDLHQRHPLIILYIKTLQFIKRCKGDISPTENSKDQFRAESLRYFPEPPLHDGSVYNSILSR